jgi:hypothetical protein
MLLRLDGTVPITFKGSTYNIPITIGPLSLLSSLLLQLFLFSTYFQGLGLFVTFPDILYSHHHRIKLIFLVSIDLPEVYPYAAPSLRVNPTPTMVVPQNHAYVDQKDGRIATPMLATWNGQSNLVSLFNEASVHCSFVHFKP